MDGFHKSFQLQAKWTRIQEWNKDAMGGYFAKKISDRGSGLLGIKRGKPFIP